MLKYILAAATALTVATTAHSATIMAGGYINGVEIHKSPVTPIPGLSCELAVASFQMGMERQLGQFSRDIKFVGMSKSVKLYKGKTSQGVDLIIACEEDGVSL
jgi:hypothetical protein